MNWFTTNGSMPESRGGQRFARSRRIVTLLAVLPLLAGNLAACSAFLFDDDELEPQRVSALPPADDEEYPTLGSVPDAAPLPSSRVRRLDLAENLAADRANAVYSDEALRAPEATVPPPPSAMTFPGPATAGAPAPALPDAPTQTADLRPLQQPDFGAAPPPPAIDEEGDRSPILPPPLPAGAATASQAPLDQSVLPGYSSAPQVAAVPQSPEYQRPQGPAPSYSQAQAGQPPVLLQQQAVQQQIYEANQLQALAMQQQAMAFEARRQAIEQQQLREQIINQNAWQLQTLQAQARQQMAALPQQTPVVPPMSYGGAGIPVPTQTAAIPPQTPVQSYNYGAPAQAAPAQSYAPGSRGGHLVGLIYFGHGSTSLSGRDRDVLRQVVDLQQRTGGRPIRVVGHASARTSLSDPVKHRVTNLNVSMSRANRVASELVRLGVRQDSVMVVGKADSEPVYHEFMPTGEAGNRRVEIFIE